VALGYLGSIGLSIDYCLRMYGTSSINAQTGGVRLRDFVSSPYGIVPFIALSAKFFVERAHTTYYLYAFFACFFWGRILQDPSRLLNIARTANWTHTLGTVAALEGMILGYFHRSAWTAGFAILGCVWPTIGMPPAFRERHSRLISAWIVACLATGVFTLLPVEKGESLTVMYVKNR
jgi:phosphatidylinositol glycan class N